MRSLRNTPVVASVVTDLAELAPGAIVLNYTNPASANTMAMAMAAERAGRAGRAGSRPCRCAPARPCPLTGTGWPSRPASARTDLRLPLEVGGINHCTGIFSLRLRDGRDAIPLVASAAPIPGPLGRSRRSA